MKITGRVENSRPKDTKKVEDTGTSVLQKEERSLKAFFR